MNSVLLKSTMLYFICTASALLMMVNNKASAAEINANSLGKEMKLSSKVLNEERFLIVQTPKGYQQGTQKYPVIYLLDGEAHIKHVSGLIEFLARNQQMPEAIVVAITNTDRTRDFTPKLSAKDDRFPTAGGADNFLSFISTEVMPLIESKYRTQPYKVLIGHSFGGLLAMHSQLTKPELFNAYITISPSAWWDNKILAKQAKEKLEGKDTYKSFVYMTLANESGKTLAGAWEITAALEQYAPEDFEWHFERMPEETHGSVHHISTYKGLKTLYKDWKISEPIELLKQEGIKGIKQYYSQLTNKFGYQVNPPEPLLNYLAYYSLEQKRVNDAFTFFNDIIKLYPTSVNALHSLGDAYKEQDKFELANQNYQLACQLAIKQNDEGKEWYCEQKAQ